MSRADRRRRARLRAKDRRLAERAYREAQAWALSIPGTPYGVKKPVRSVTELQELLATRKDSR